MASMNEAGDELYALPPHAFTAARDAKVAQARQAGDRAAASALAALKRPTVSAWLANLIALRRPEELDRLIRLGEEIRAAQGRVPAQQLRDLSARRRQEIDALTARARALAQEIDGTEPARQYLTELEGTLGAAMADARAAQAVRTGRTLKPLAYSGFGDAATPGEDPLAAALAASLASAPARATATTAERAAAGAGSGRAGSGRAAPGQAASEQAAQRAAAERAAAERAAAERAAAGRAEAERAEAQARAEAAKARLAEASAALADATGAEQAAEERVRDLTARLAAVKEELDAANRQAREARQRRIAAEREQATARRRADRSVQFGQ